MKHSLPFSAFPNGWFRVAYSEELPPGKVIPLRYFSQDLVLFRANDGQPHIFNAHCPHLGAHLGYGGKVTETGIQCPFHGWCFDSKGQCVRIPYASKIPPKAEINTWPVRETNGIIMMYYHPQRRSPDWEIPALPEYASSDWIPFQRRRWKVRTSVYEIAENGVDSAHSPFVHAQTFSSLQSNGLDLNDSVSTHRLSFATILLGKKTKGELKITSYGLGFQVSRTWVKTIVELNFTAIFLLTPIDENYLEVDLVFTMKNIFHEQLTRFLIAPWLIREVGRNLEEDIPIWENKIFRSDPLLCNGDGPIAQYRHWARRFFGDK